MKVLVIDDKDDELQRAEEAARELGWECITNNPVSGESWTWIELVEEVDGVVTDLMWHYHRGGEKPQGLLVVAHALFKDKPVVICTQVSDYNISDHGISGRHSEAISFIYDGYVSVPVFTAKAFGWVQYKDWKEAFKLLAQRVKKPQE